MLRIYGIPGPTGSDIWFLNVSGIVNGGLNFFGKPRVTMNKLHCKISKNSLSISFGKNMVTEDFSYSLFFNFSLERDIDNSGGKSQCVISHDVYLLFESSTFTEIISIILYFL